MKRPDFSADPKNFGVEYVDVRPDESRVVVVSKKARLVRGRETLAGDVQVILPRVLVIQLNRAFQHVSQNEINL